MDKAEISANINEAKRKLEEYQAKLRELREKLNVLESVIAKIQAKTSTFEQSMTRRKGKLNSFESLLSCVKSAIRYKEKMNSMLNGSAYRATVNSIDKLKSSTSSQRKKVIDDIKYVESKISYYKARVGKLQYEYDNYKEEEGNGK